MKRHTSRIATLALFLFCFAAPAAEMTSEQLYEKFKPAVVKISVYQQGVRVMMGSGFFVDPDGGVITNSHVAEMALAGQFRAEFTLSDGTVVKDFEVARCSDTRGIDLCYMKIAAKPKTWFEPKRTEFKVGQTLFTIGHPKGFEFTISQGLLSGVRRMSARGFKVDEGPNSVETIQINAPISPGNSGGPAFNSKGELIGVVTWARFELDSKELNFTVSVNEVADFIAKSPAFISRKGFVDRKRAADKKLEATLKKTVTDPAWDTLIANEKARAEVKRLDPAHWARFELKTDLGTYETFIPRSMAKSCRDDVTSTKIRFTECTDANGGTLQFRLVPSADAFAEVKELGKVVPEPLPLPIVKALKANGEWDEISKKLTPDQRKFLFTVPEKFKCKESKNSYFRPGKTFMRCSMLIFNDSAPSAASSAITIGQIGAPHVVRVLGWTPGGLESIYFAYAAISAELMQIPTAGNPVVTAPSTPEDGDSLKKLLSHLRNAMLATKSEFGSFPRDLNKVLSDKDLAFLNLPTNFHYRVFVMPACARQSKPSDKTEVSNVDAAKMKAASGQTKTIMSRVMKAGDAMNDKLVDQKCPSPRENFNVIGVGYENETLTIALVDRRKVDILTRNGVKQ